MPFQVSFSIKKNQPPVVTLLTAGVDQLIFCGSVVTLEAIVDDELNLPGHILEWEQTAGNIVSLSCPTCLITTYPLGDSSDKTFRFWIDRGTAKEQYDDVEVSHTPTSVIPTSSQISTPDVDYGIASDSPECSSIILAPNPPELQSAPNEGLGLTWDIPPKTYLQSFITQYTVYENDIPVQTTLANEPRFYPGTIQAIYQIFTEFLIHGVLPSSEFSCERDFINDLEYPLTIAIDEFIPPSSQISAPLFTITRFGNILIRGDDITSVVPTSSQISTPTFSIVKFSNIVIDSQLSIVPTSSQISTPLFTITRFDTGNIGG